MHTMRMTGSKRIVIALTVFVVLLGLATWWAISTYHQISYVDAVADDGSVAAGTGEAAGIVWVVYGLLALLIVSGTVCILIKPVELHVLFLIFAVCLGLIYSFVMTPMAIPDEDTHYQSVYKVSNYLCFQWDNPDVGDAKHFDYSGYQGHYNVSSGYERVMQDFFAPSPSYKEQAIPLKYDLQYPVMLLPQAVGLTIGRLLGTNSVVTFYLGRWMNLLFYVFCGYYAIKTAPRFKLLFFLVGIMPMALHQAASYSYDVFINGLSMLFVAMVLKAAYGDEKIRPGQIIALIVTGVLLAPAKAVYSFILLTFFIIPIRKFPNKKTYFISLSIALICTVVTVWMFDFAGIMSAEAAGTSGAANLDGKVNYTVSDIIGNPGGTIEVFFNSIIRLGIPWFAQSVGFLLAGHTMQISFWKICAYAILIFASVMITTEKQKPITWKARVIMMVSAVIAALLVMLSMFLGWTANIYDVIHGVQGRYFIPVLPLVFIAISLERIPIKKPLEKCFIMAGVLINLSILHEVLMKTVMV